MAHVQIRHERRVWSTKDENNNIVGNHDVIETWARMPGTNVWTLIGAQPYAEAVGSL